MFLIIFIFKKTKQNYYYSFHLFFSSALKDLAINEFYDYQVAPFLYIEETGEIDDENAQKLKDKLYPKKVATAALIVMIVAGVLLICVSVFFYFRQLK